MLPGLDDRERFPSWGSNPFAQQLLQHCPHPAPPALPHSRGPGTGHLFVPGEVLNLVPTRPGDKAGPSLGDFPVLHNGRGSVEACGPALRPELVPAGGFVVTLT